MACRRARLSGDIASGFEDLYLHQVGTDQAGLTETFGAEVIPALSGA